MTQSPQPGEILTSESVKLLKAGDAVRHPDGRTGFFEAVEANGGLSVLTIYDGLWIFWPERDQIAFIGRPDQDGWIHAPHGGWTENPVPGCEVFIRAQEQESAVAHSDWTWAPDIIAFRLAAPSVERDLGSLPASPSVPTGTLAYIAANLGLAKIARAIDPDAWAHIDACHEAMKSLEGSQLDDFRKVIERRLRDSGSIPAAERVVAALREAQVGMKAEGRNEPNPSPEPDVAGAREQLLADLREVEKTSRLIYRGDHINRNGHEAADKIQRQGEEIERLRARNEKLCPVHSTPYDPKHPDDLQRLVREVGGYLKTCRGSCGSDTKGRDHAIECLDAIAADLIARARQGGPDNG